MNCLLYSILFIMLTAFHTTTSVPLTGVNTSYTYSNGEDNDEEPTSETLPAPQIQEEPIVRHEFLANLYGCLVLRDERKNLSAAGCVPRVFTTVEDAPVSSLSDTVLGFIANCSIHEHNMTLTLEVSEQTVLDNLKSVHLRIHKNKVDDDFVRRFKDECDLTDGLRLSLHILSPNKVSIQEMTLSYNDLLKEEWTDFTSFKDIYNSTLHSAEETVLQLEIDIKNCTSLTLQDIGINTGKGKEPVLVVYGKQHDAEDKFDKMLNDSILQQRTRRNIESSGAAPIIDSEKCRLIKHNVSCMRTLVNLLLFESNFPLQILTSHVDPDVYIRKQFELNYCSGQCEHPLGGLIHTQILASFQVPRNLTSEHSMIPPPCCVPTKYSPISFPVTETEYKYKIYTLPDISARECACR